MEDYKVTVEFKHLQQNAPAGVCVFCRKKPNFDFFPSS